MSHDDPHSSTFQTGEYLCARCESIQIDQMLGQESFPHHPTFLALKRSADNGCRLCHFLCISLEQGFKGQKYLDLSLLSDDHPGYQLRLKAREVSLDRIILCFNEENVSTDSNGLPPGWDQDLENPLGYLDIFADPGTFS